MVCCSHPDFLQGAAPPLHSSKPGIVGLLNKKKSTSKLKQHPELKRVDCEAKA
ncbi:Hypothetical predicted protein [Scomber scombrus]|uniref:Uncharacterized protein n=1 Tax=Scomber scombrus TaxID=13677 RepID=A0AAV1N6U4_SCOSC